MKTHEVWPSYTTDLGMEALLACYDATADTNYLRHVEKVWEYRAPPAETLTPGNCYFTCLHYETYLRTGESRYVTGLVDLARDWLENGPRNCRGTLGHRKMPQGALFVDLLGGLAPLLARAGALSGQEVFFEESARLIDLYRETLRDPLTGLWHHAYGWHGKGVLSPLAWCRGCGWVLRGMEKSIQAMPTGFPGRSRLIGFFEEFLLALIPFQNADGVWHQLVQRPDSYAESSGTGFLLAALASPVLREEGACLSAPRFEEPLRRGIRGLAGFVNSSGLVAGGCPECPPQRNEEDYGRLAPRLGDPHAQAAALLALAAARSAHPQRSPERYSAAESEPVQVVPYPPQPIP